MIATKVRSSFPTKDWFNELAQIATQTLDPKALGWADLNLGLEIIGPSETYNVVVCFDGYEINVSDSTEFDKVDAIVSGPINVFEAMIKDIQSHGFAQGPYTFNALTIAGIPLSIRSDDPLNRDKVFRYAQTIQHFFDSAAKLETI